MAAIEEEMENVMALGQAAMEIENDVAAKIEEMEPDAQVKRIIA